MKKSVLYLFTFLVIAACSDTGSFEDVPFFEQETGPGLLLEDGVENQTKNSATPMESNINQDAVGGNSLAITDQPMVVQRKLIWAADLEFQVKDVDLSTQKIMKLCEKYDGFISDMELTNNNYQISNQITIRVSNKQFHALVNASKGEALFVDRANVSSNDVSEEFVDIESRLKTKRDVRDRYIKVLREKTGTISDIIEAEEAIRKITEEIEAKEGRLRFLKDRVDNSTIVMNIYETVDYIDQPERYDKGYGEEVGDSFSKGWGAMTSIFLALVTIWPLLLFLIIGYWRRKWIIKLFSGKLGK
ncbi:MAG: hypothetical protein ACI837_000478 [Crocinitomicaceae bacterium]|jgi:hypothetical protein